MSPFLGPVADEIGGSLQRRIQIEPNTNHPREAARRSSAERAALLGEALLRDIAAVDHQLGPGDERCLVRGEEQHAIGNFDRLTEAAEWSERNLVGTLIGIRRIQHWRHIAGMHRIDPNAQGAIAYRLDSYRSALHLSRRYRRDGRCRRRQSP